MARYNTKQREAVLLCLAGGGHTTAAQLRRQLEQEGCAASQATVYRHLEALEEQGLVKKYLMDGAAACYQLVQEEACASHYHLKCEECGALDHTVCAVLDDLQTHIRTEHGFEVDVGKTIFYGLCKGCMRKIPRRAET